MLIADMLDRRLGDMDLTNTKCLKVLAGFG